MLKRRPGVVPRPIYLPTDIPPLFFDNCSRSTNLIPSGLSSRKFENVFRTGLLFFRCLWSIRCWYLWLLFRGQTFRSEQKVWKYSLFWSLIKYSRCNNVWKENFRSYKEWVWSSAKKWLVIGEMALLGLHLKSMFLLRPFEYNVMFWWTGWRNI